MSLSMSIDRVVATAGTTAAHTDVGTGMDRARTPLAVVLAGAVSLALLGCGDDTLEPASPPATSPSSSTPAPPPPELDGREFLSVGGPGASATTISFVEGSRLRLSFEAGAVRAHAGCNSMSGAYRVEGGRLVVTELSRTEMGCSPDLMAQDDTIAQLLTAAPSVTLDGDRLVLAHEDLGVELLDREVADPDRPLAGTRWEVTTVLEGDVASGGWADASAAVVFELEGGTGRVLVEAGCNRGSAAVTVSDDTIAFGPLALTKMLCPEPAMQLEAAVTRTLQGEVAFRIEAGTLTLLGDGHGLQLTAVP